MGEAAKKPVAINACPAVHRRVTVQVQSNSDPEKTYTVEFTDPGDVKCECPSFTHRGHCRHVSVEETECGWRSDRSLVKQKDPNVCPLCGSETELRMWGGR